MSRHCLNKTDDDAGLFVSKYVTKESWPIKLLIFEIF